MADFAQFFEANPEYLLIFLTAKPDLLSSSKKSFDEDFLNVDRKMTMISGQFEMHQLQRLGASCRTMVLYMCSKIEFSQLHNYDIDTYIGYLHNPQMEREIL